MNSRYAITHLRLPQDAKERPHEESTRFLREDNAKQTQLSSFTFGNQFRRCLEHFAFITTISPSEVNLRAW